jgi:hypothetical protein
MTKKKGQLRGGLKTFKGFKIDEDIAKVTGLNKNKRHTFPDMLKGLSKYMERKKLKPPKKKNRKGR